MGKSCDMIEVNLHFFDRYYLLIYVWNVIFHGYICDIWNNFSL